MAAIIAKLKEAIGFNVPVWVRSIGRMRALARGLDAGHSPDAAGPACLVVITPWLGTSIPWFTLGVGLMLARNGARVTFALDDHRFGPNVLRSRFIRYALRRVMDDVATRHPVIDVRALAPVSADADATSEIARLAQLNAIWELRGEMVQQGRPAREAHNAACLAAAYGKIAAVFRDNRFDMMFVPGGVFGLSGLWCKFARRAGVRVSTFDSGGYETVMLAVDGLACQLGDVPCAYHAIRARNANRPRERAATLAAADAEIAKRREGSDAFESQIKNAGAGSDALEGGVLIALNSSWDAAALGLHVVFDSNTDWIVETVRILLDETSAPVIVRQHPAERLAFAATSDDYGALLARHFPDEPRLHFIAAADPVNSYALLQRVRAVVVHSSTIGTEAAAFGRPVITGSRAYYSNLGFVWSASDIETYRSLLRDAGAGKLEVTQAMRDDAKLCFYVTQCRNWIFSPFNPADYSKWSLRSLDHWRTQPAISRMLQGIADNRTAAELNHADAMAVQFGEAADKQETQHAAGSCLRNREDG